MKGGHGQGARLVLDWERLKETGEFDPTYTTSRRPEPIRSEPSVLSLGGTVPSLSRQVLINETWYKALHERFEQIHSRMLKERVSLIDVWREDAATDTPYYKYSQFATLYAAWRRECGLVKLSRRKRSTISLKPEDIPNLKQWRRSNDRRKWEIAVALLELTSGTS